MKRLFLLLACLVLISAVSFADNDTAIAVDKLPQTAQQFIKQHFADIQVSYAKMESDKSYEVIFVNGCKVEFDANGEWEDIDCKYTEVPAGAVPQKIQEYITQNQPNAKVVQIEKDRRDYELKLSNRAELKFDLMGRFIGYDD